MFTVLSFLTTTGFSSSEWGAAQAWSGLETPGVLLMGLSLIGGGVATTAGGVKLLRVFALYQNGLREKQKKMEQRPLKPTQCETQDHAKDRQCQLSQYL